MTTPTPRETALRLVRMYAAKEREQADAYSSLGGLRSEPDHQSMAFHMMNAEAAEATIAWLESLPDDVGEYGVRAFVQGVEWAPVAWAAKETTAADIARRLLAEGALGTKEHT